MTSSDSPSTSQGSLTSFRVLVDGYSRALARLGEAASALDGIAAQQALFESLNWATTIDEAIAELWRPERDRVGFSWRERRVDATPMRGLRAARNRVHHQWADAVVLDPNTGRGYPRVYPMRYNEFRWRPLTELPPVPPKHHRPADDEAYRQHLEGQVVRAALVEVERAFIKLAELLEPPTPTPSGPPPID